MAAWQNLIIQLGISGLIVFVMYKIGLKLLSSWAENEKRRVELDSEREKERNQNIAQGFVALSANISSGFAAITATQTSLADGVQKTILWCARIEQQLATVLDLTPVRSLITIPPINVPPSPVVGAVPVASVIIEGEGDLDDQDTPVDRPAPPPRQKVQTPVKGTPTGIYGVSPTKRKPTSGG